MRGNKRDTKRGTAAPIPGGEAKDPVLAGGVPIENIHMKTAQQIERELISLERQRLDNEIRDLRLELADVGGEEEVLRNVDDMLMDYAGSNDDTDDNGTPVNGMVQRVDVFVSGYRPAGATEWGVQIDVKTSGGLAVMQVVGMSPNDMGWLLQRLLTTITGEPTAKLSDTTSLPVRVTTIKLLGENGRSEVLGLTSIGYFLGGKLFDPRAEYEAVCEMAPDGVNRGD